MSGFWVLLRQEEGVTNGAFEGRGSWGAAVNPGGSSVDSGEEESGVPPPLRLPFLTRPRGEPGHTPRGPVRAGHTEGPARAHTHEHT